MTEMKLIPRNEVEEKSRVYHLGRKIIDKKPEIPR